MIVFFKGMSRDKCGAANVAGFVRTVAALAPKNLRVVSEVTHNIMCECEYECECDGE